MALAPASIVLAIALFSESLFIFLLTLGIWLWGERRGVAAGIAFGLATLCRPVLLPFAALVAVAALVFRFNRALHLRIALCAAIVVTPWIVRNAVTQHAFIPVSTLGWGANVFLGTIDTPYGKDTVWTASARDPAFTAIIATQTSEVDAERCLFAAGVARVVEAPLHWLLVAQLPVLTDERYGLPMVPMLVVYAAVALSRPRNARARP